MNILRLRDRVQHIGFSGVYNDAGAEADATALVGKRSVRYDAILRLLVTDEYYCVTSSYGHVARLRRDSKDIVASV